MGSLKRTFLFAALFLISCGVVDSAAQKNSDLKKVTVYFWEFNRQGGGDDMIPFARYVDNKAPLRPTIEALIAGPTKEENPDKFSSVAYGDVKLSSIKIRRGTARIDFTRTIRGDYNPGDLETLRFEGTVIRTAKQFPEIKKVIVCVNGINEFGIGMVEDAPRPCPTKW
ncbi:MAG TPA: GerMN domain-containing protein [Pyrinomonadaceae bacterium]|nr:GerMN domain-containing protein [Pyrinomonadaceae bacterium]